MNRLATTYNRINEILQNQQHHNLTSDDILALKEAQKAILVIETLGLSLKNDDNSIT